MVDSNVFIEANFYGIFRRVGVIGAGTMGNGIAHVFARGGYDVVLCDVEQRFLDRALWEPSARIWIAKSRRIRSPPMTKPRHLKRIQPVTDRAQAGGLRFRDRSGDREV